MTQLDNNKYLTGFTPNYSQGKAKISGKFSVIQLKPFLKYGNGAFVPQLFNHLPQFDIIHLHYPFFGGAEIVWLVKLLYGRKVKLIIHYHMDVESVLFFTKILSWPSRLIRCSLFRKAEAVTCASLDYIEHSKIKNVYYKYKNKFFEVPFGVDIEKFRPAKKGSEKRFLEPLKGSRNLNNLNNILFVGGLDKAHYFKGVDVLLKAVTGLKLSNWQLNIVGDGDLRPQYEKQAQELGIGQEVNFAGKVNDEQLVRHYQEANVLVLPSINKNEAFGLVLLEAMACSTPVIASNLPGVRSVFQDGIQGLLVESGDADDLKNKIKQIFKNNEKRKQMGLAGRKLVEEKYSWERVGEKLDLLYKRLHGLFKNLT